MTGRAMGAAAISDHEFGLFRRLMEEVAGVCLPPTRKSLVSGRLQQRLHHLGLGSFGDYFRTIASGGNPDELERAVDLLTTHETSFFRESQHFDFLAREVLCGHSGDREFRAWSAACSSGEEPWSIAMVLMEGLGTGAPWEVLGTDVSAAMVALARRGVYAMDRIRNLPEPFRRRHCLRGVGPRAGTLRIGEILRKRTRFARVNLNAPLPDIGLFDVIFLRNVLIYFGPATRQQVVDRLASRLRPGGWLFVGHSESLAGLAHGLSPVRPSVYRKR